MFMIISKLASLVSKQVKTKLFISRRNNFNNILSIFFVCGKRELFSHQVGKHQAVLTNINKGKSESKGNFEIKVFYEYYLYFFYLPLY